MQNKQRINLSKTEPKGYSLLFKFEEYLEKTPISIRIRNLIKIRASQINGCNYCIHLHTEEALAAGESTKRLFALSTWRESAYFSEEERTVLALTEEVTLISNHGVSDEVYSKTMDLFGEQYLAQLLIAINTINTWNRIGVATRLLPD